MELIRNYMNDPERRRMLNDLARRTFCIDFEDWVSGGWFSGDYIPYSLVENGRLLANASANIMTFDQNGERRNYIQIGTVMTDEEYRGRGLARQLVGLILDDHSGCDGVYLFGNMSALGFYRKLGFGELNQRRYSVKPEYCVKNPAGGFAPATIGLLQEYVGAVRNSAVNSSLEQVNKFGLQMFYTADMSEVSYAEDIGCFAVMERSGGAVELKSIISTRRVPLNEVIRRIAADSITLGFSPLPDDMYLCSSEPYDGAEDYRLFFKGEKLREIETQGLYFPELSHA